LKEKTGSSATDTGRRLPEPLENDGGAEDDREAFAGKTKSGRGRWVSLSSETVVAIAISESRTAAAMSDFG
jgi:hypothetical protein